MKALGVTLAALVLVCSAGAAPTTGATSSSGGTAAGHCSKAVAVQVVKRLHLGNADFTSAPVAQVLCGAFVGPGSEAMVASLSIPSCGRTGGWVVFRYAGGTWQPVMERNNGADLTAVGNDIRESQFVLRPGEAHCFPTGGTRARTWHWNGSRFTSTPWKQATPPTAPTTTHLFNFLSPSHNIWCDSGDEDHAYCVSANLPHSVTLAHDGTVTICNGRRCVGNTKLFGSATPVLAYGRQNEQGGYRCRSETTGITCTDILPGKNSGKGFKIDRAGVTRIR